SWHRPLIDSKLENQKHVERNEPDQQSRNNKHMDREEPRQRRCTDDRAAQQEAHQGRPDERNSTRDGGSNAEPPVGVLIKPQYLPGKRHPQRHQKEEDSDDPGQLSRVLVGAEEENLDHVNQNDRQHEVRAPTVERADEPAGGDLLIQSLQAAPSLAGRWDVDDRQQNAGDKLQDERRQSGATKDVKPTRAPRRDRMRETFLDRLSELQALAEPAAYFF